MTKDIAKFLKYFALTFAFCGFFFIQDASATQKLNSTTYLTLNAFGVQSMTITPSYWAFVRGHHGSILLYSRSSKKQVGSTDIKSQCNGDDITYYSKNNELIVYPGCRYKADKSLKYLGMTKIHSPTGSGIVSYAKDGGFFVSGSRSKISVYSHIINKGKKTATYGTHGEPNGSLVYKGILYRISNSDVFAYDLDKGGKLLGQWKTDARNHCQDMDVDESGNIFILCLGGKSEVRMIKGPASFVKLFKRSYNATKNDSGNSNSSNNATKNPSGNSNSSNSESKSGDTNNEENKVQDKPDEQGLKCAILTSWCDTVQKDGKGTIILILKFIIDAISIILAILATIGLVYSGILIMTARGNVEQVKKAKNRILEIVIGLIIWALLWSLATFLLPTSGDVIENAIIIKQGQVAKTLPVY